MAPLFIAVGLGLALTETAAATADEPYPETDIVVAEMQSRFGISAEQALQTLQYQERYAIYATALELEFENNYAGSWIAHEDGGILVVAMVAPQVAEKNVPDDLLDRVRFVVVERPLKLLEEIANDLNAKIPADAGFASPDLERNGIWIELLPAEMTRVSSLPGLVSAVEALKADGISVTFRELDGLPSDDACSSPSNCNPLVAGAAINGPSTCSSGFKVSVLGSGAVGMLTAKHCNPGTYSHYIYNVLTSTGGASSPYADVRFLASTGALAIADDVLYFGQLYDMSGFANPPLYSQVCRGGRMSFDCGTSTIRIFQDTDFGSQRCQLARGTVVPLTSSEARLTELTQEAATLSHVRVPRMSPATPPRSPMRCLRWV